MNGLRGVTTPLGVWGQGMYGVLLPPSLNGPLGPGMAIDDTYPNMSYEPPYNARKQNAPAYNSRSFEKISGYDLGQNFGKNCVELK